MDLFLAPRAGIWCRSACGWEAFRAALARSDEPAERVPEPFPELLPARERRRAPLHVRLALEAGLQACRANSVALTDVMTVFASAMGDTQITDYMCRTLASATPVMSPTRFHNSVHNAASGYWSIGTGNRLAGTAVAGQEFTFATALLEAAALASAEQAAVLLVAHDVAAEPPLDAVSPNRQAFATALILAATPAAGDWLAVRITLVPYGGEPPARAGTWLGTLAEENPGARAAPLLAALAGTGAWPVMLPFGASRAVRIAPRDGHRPAAPEERAAGVSSSA